MKSPSKPGGADLRAMRDLRLQAAPVSEAARRESSFLRNVAAAGEDLEWILFNQAWTELGFERVGDWWEQRVLPVLVHLDLRPSVALADRVIEAITADETGLPSAQRRTQREIASIARTSQSRVARSRAESNDSEADLETAASPEVNVPGLQDAIDRATTQDTPVVQPPTPDAPEAAYSEPRTGSVDGQPEVDRQDANPGETDEGADLSVADGAATPSVEREPGPTGVSAPAPAIDHSGGRGEEQGQAAASVPAPETDEDRAARERLEYRTDRTIEFSTGLVNVRMRLEGDPIAWFENVYLPGAYSGRDLPRVRDSFTPAGLIETADYLYALADYFNATGRHL